MSTARARAMRVLARLPRRRRRKARWRSGRDRQLVCRRRFEQCLVVPVPTQSDCAIQALVGVVVCMYFRCRDVVGAMSWGQGLVPPRSAPSSRRQRLAGRSAAGGGAMPRASPPQPHFWCARSTTSARIVVVVKTRCFAIEGRGQTARGQSARARRVLRVVRQWVKPDTRAHRAVVDMGLFSSESEDEEPFASASKPMPTQGSTGGKKGGLFDDSDSDDDGGPLGQPAAASKASTVGSGAGGLFGDEPDSEPPVATVTTQPPQQKPAPVKSSSAGLFADSDDEDDDGPLVASPPAPKAAVAVAASAPAPAPAPARSVGGLFGDDSDDDSDAAGLFGGSSKPPAGSKAPAPAGLFANDVPSDDEGGLFGSTADTLGGGTAAAEAEVDKAAGGQWDQSSIGRLIDMGFARVDVEAALAAKDGDVQQAADWLLVGGTAAAAERTSDSAPVASDSASTPQASSVDGGLDQSSAFLGARTGQSTC